MRRGLQKEYRARYWTKRDHEKLEISKSCLAGKCLFDLFIPSSRCFRKKFPFQTGSKILMTLGFSRGFKILSSSTLKTRFRSQDHVLILNLTHRKKAQLWCGMCALAIFCCLIIFAWIIGGFIQALARLIVHQIGDKPRTSQGMEQKHDLHHKREPQNLASLNWIKANRKSPLHKLNKFEKSWLPLILTSGTFLSKLTAGS